MSKYDKETKFYWLQLKEDFFENDAIEWLEEQKPNGRDYAYFYLKLCLKSLKSNGVLIRKVGNVLIPYDNRKLAELTRMDFDTVTVAMELLQNIGLVTIFESGEIYINQLDNLIGSQSKGAFKKQQQRLISIQVADKCPPKIEIKDRNKTKDIYIKEENIKEEKIQKKYYENLELNTLFLEFLELRKKLKCKNTDRAINLLLNELNKYDDTTKIEMINNSIMNSWKSVYPIKDFSTKKGKTDEFGKVLKEVYDGTIQFE